MQLGKTPALESVPPFREELRLIPANNNPDGSPAWMILDPIVNKFYRMSWLDYEILIRWHLSDINQIVTAVNQETTLLIDQQDVEALIHFLSSSQLLQLQHTAGVDYLIETANKNKQNTLLWLLHHYLFFRIPLIRPQKLLENSLPYLRWIFSAQTAWLIALISFMGIFLAARQWDTFSATFVDNLSWAGLLSFGVALICSKLLHEFGHALTATRYGIRVGHMGVAFLVLFPMPYTDTSESWKLDNPTHRLHIASAGIITELALAGLATFAWSLAPDGVIKSALFFLATTSWVLTLLINLSPFLRFDGYFILSDLFDFPNLHERAGNIAKTWLRRHLLGVEDDWPEDFSPKKRHVLTLFAFTTWLYRFIIFIGIALLVYYFFFKVLGIILFIVEIWWFILLPIWKEVSLWYQRRTEIKHSRKILALCCLIGLLALGFVPWQSSVTAHAWIHASKQSLIYTPISGKLIDASAAGTVKQHDTLFQLTSPDISLQAIKAQGLAIASEAELRSLTGLDDGESQRAQLQLKQEKLYAEVKLFEDELSRMSLSAPFDGVLLDIDDSLSIGSWVDSKQALAVLIDPNSWVIDVFVPEAEINRIDVNNAVKIYLKNSQLQRLTGMVMAIDQNRVNKLPHPMLDAQYGGELTTLTEQPAVPNASYYKVRVAFDQMPQLSNMMLATAKIDTHAKALLPRFFERMAALLIRESGF